MDNQVEIARRINELVAERNRLTARIKEIDVELFGPPSQGSGILIGPAGFEPATS